MTQGRATVWSINPTDDDLSSIANIGEVRYVNSRYIYGDEISDDRELPHNFVRHIREAAQKFNPQLDYLLINGDHLQLVALSAELGEMYGAFQVLRWDRRERVYIAAWIRTSLIAVPALTGSGQPC